MATAKKSSSVPADERTVEQTSTLEYISFGDTRVNPQVQREFVPARANEIAANFDPEFFGIPAVNWRGGWYYIMDGQHRIEGAKIWLGDGWEEQKFQARVYKGLSEKQEAETFLRLNNTMAVNAFNKFKVAVTAGRPDESAISLIVRNLGMKITLDRNVEGRVAAVGTLLRIYRKFGGTVLARTLEIIRNTYGNAGLEASPLAGMALVVNRYGESTDDNEVVERLSNVSGGIGNIMNKAEREKVTMGIPLQEAVAAALVNAYNSKTPKGGKRLRNWYKD